MATAEKKQPKPKKESNGNTKADLLATIADYTEDADLRQALDDFRVMRERIRHPLTVRALRVTFNELDKHAGQDTALKVRILDQSIQRGWQGVFPLKENYTQQTGMRYPVNSSYQPSDLAKKAGW